MRRPEAGQRCSAQGEGSDPGIRVFWCGCWTQYGGDPTCGLTLLTHVIHTPPPPCISYGRVPN